MVKNRTVYFAGPLPPPTHGLSVISAHMLDALALGGTKVHVFDLTPRSMFTPLSQWVRYLWTLLNSKYTQSILYLPLSGGLRQMVDLFFVVPASFSGCQIFIHHHSFAYLNAKPWFSRFIFRFLKKSIHVALCSKMGELLSREYGIDPSNIRVLSNAAFIDSAPPAPIRFKGSASEITLGFLSNITAEKGIFLFFETLEVLRINNLACRALIAGPVSVEIRAEFEKKLKNSPDTVHLGAVYGDAKHDFFRSVDILLFPTLYANEAEPVTLWEAMSHGIPVIALERGCIQGMVPGTAGRVLPEPAAFTSAVVEEVANILRTEGLQRQQGDAARVAFEEAQNHSREVLGLLVSEMKSHVPEC